MTRFVYIEHEEVGPAPHPVSEAAARHYALNGWRVAGADESAAPAEHPHLNGSTAEWREFAVQHGMAAEQAEELSRDELVAHFVAPTQKATTVVNPAQKES